MVNPTDSSFSYDRVSLSCRCPVRLYYQGNKMEVEASRIELLLDVSVGSGAVRLHVSASTLFRSARCGLFFSSRH